MGPSHNPQFTMHVTPQTFFCGGRIGQAYWQISWANLHETSSSPATLMSVVLVAFNQVWAMAPLVRGSLLVCPYYCYLTRKSPNMAFYTPGDMLALSHPAATERTGHRGRLGANETLLRTYSPLMSSQEASYTA